MHRETMSVLINGQEIIFETGKIARQAGGAVVVRCGETIVFSTACAAPMQSLLIFYLYASIIRKNFLLRAKRSAVLLKERAALRNEKFLFLV